MSPDGWIGSHEGIKRAQKSPRKSSSKGLGRITRGDFPGIDIRGKSEEPIVPSQLKLGHWDENN